MRLRFRSVSARFELRPMLAVGLAFRRHGMYLLVGPVFVEIERSSW